MTNETSTLPKSDLDQLRWRLGLYERVNRTISEKLLEPYQDRLLKLKDLQGTLEGKRAFVVGNGPSLNNIEMRKLKDEITFGSNRVYLGFEDWGFNFTYWAVQDETQIIQSAADYARALPDSTIKFVPDIFLHLFPLDRFENCCPVPLELHPIPFPQFSGSIHIQYNGWTVTFLLIQLSVALGAKEVILLGTDHSYQFNKEDIISPNRWKDSSSKNHFHPNYASPSQDHVWNMPKFEYMDPAYELAADWAKKNCVRIANATPGSQLEAFEKVSFESLF